MLPKMSSFAMLPATRTLKDVADAEIHDHFGRRSRVDAAKDYRGGKLPLGSGFLFVAVVARGHQTLAKVLIATLQLRQDFVWRHLVAFFFAQRVSVDEAAE
jgi:hypothetical protein